MYKYKTKMKKRSKIEFFVVKTIWYNSKSQIYMLNANEFRHKNRNKIIYFTGLKKSFFYK